MRVLFHDIARKLALGNAAPVGGLAELLRASDLVTLHVPETPQTSGLMDAARLASMKPGAFLINASRGSIVDLDALREAVVGGLLGGAALDVFPEEPSSRTEPFDSPLRGLENVILTPHIGGTTREAQESIAADVVAKLVGHSDRGTTLGAVNFPELNLAPHREGHRVLHVHRDVPGVLREINDVFAARELNIVGQHLGTRDGIGYVVLDTDAVAEDEILPPLKAIEGTIRTRTIATDDTREGRRRGRRTYRSGGFGRPWFRGDARCLKFSTGSALPRESVRAGSTS